MSVQLCLYVRIRASSPPNFSFSRSRFLDIKLPNVESSTVYENQVPDGTSFLNVFTNETLISSMDRYPLPNPLLKKGILRHGSSQSLPFPSVLSNSSTLSSAPKRVKRDNEGSVGHALWVSGGFDIHDQLLCTEANGSGQFSSPAKERNDPAHPTLAMFQSLSQKGHERENTEVATDGVGDKSWEVVGYPKAEREVAEQPKAERAKQRRRERNRALARKTRSKKKAELESLTSISDTLRSENEKLKTLVCSCRGENLRKQLDRSLFQGNAADEEATDVDFPTAAYSCLQSIAAGMWKIYPCCEPATTYSFFVFITLFGSFIYIIFHPRRPRKIQFLYHQLSSLWYSYILCILFRCRAHGVFNGSSTWLERFESVRRF